MLLIVIKKKLVTFIKEKLIRKQLTLVIVVG